ncbi:hypothetical protein [Nostoc sp.]
MLLAEAGRLARAEEPVRWVVLPTCTPALKQATRSVSDRRTTGVAE